MRRVCGCAIAFVGAAASVACGTTSEAVEPLSDASVRHSDGKTDPVDAGRHDVAVDPGEREHDD